MIKSERSGDSWSDEDEARLREMFARDVHRKLIARELGRSRGAVDARLKALGLLKPRYFRPK